MYEDDLKRRVAEAQKRVEQGIAASSFHKKPEGKLLQDYIDERVSYLLNKLTGNKPLDRDEYLSIHGGILELKNINTMLQAKQQALPSNEEELRILNEQVVSGQKPVKF